MVSVNNVYGLSGHCPLTLSSLFLGFSPHTLYRAMHSEGMLIHVQFTMHVIFSSPEPLGSQGELIVYPSSRRPSVCRPSIVRPSSVVHHFQRSSPLNRLANQSQILCGASLGRGNESLYKWSRSHDQDGRHAHVW